MWKGDSGSWRSSGRVRNWRSGLGLAYLFPSLSPDRAARAEPCSIFNSPSSNRTYSFPEYKSKGLSSLSNIKSTFKCQSHWSRHGSTFYLFLIKFAKKPRINKARRLRFPIVLTYDGVDMSCLITTMIYTAFYACRDERT